MDADRFDSLTRTLTAPISRRVTLGRFVAGVLVALGLAVEETPLLAKKKGNGKGNGKGKKKNKKDFTDPLYPDGCWEDCTAGVAPWYMKDPACCRDSCRDLHANPYNCGACFNYCPRKTKPLCYAGQCREKCPQGLTKCGNTCLHQSAETCCNGRVIAIEDLQHDASNCGGCGTDCSALATSTRPPMCCSGVCCDYNSPACCSGQCTNLNGLEPGNTHCGACGNTCPTGQTCRLGACA